MILTGLCRSQTKATAAPSTVQADSLLLTLGITAFGVYTNCRHTGNARC
jgi:hypothetical protein